MEQQTMIDHNSIPTGDHNAGAHPLVYLILWGLGLMFNWISLEVASFSFSDISTIVYTWIFRALTLVSLILIITLNWKNIRKKEK